MGLDRLDIVPHPSIRLDRDLCPFSSIPNLVDRDLSCTVSGFPPPPHANEPQIVSTTQKRGNPPTQPTMAKEKLSDGSAGEPDASMAKQRGAKEEERKAWKRFVESDKWKKVDNETEWVHEPIPLEQVRETWPNRTLAVHGWTVEDAKRNLPYLDEDPHAPLPAVAHFQKVKIEDFEVRRE